MKFTDTLVTLAANTKICVETALGAKGHTTPENLFTNPKFTITGGATGDIYYQDSGGNFARLGVGVNGQVMTLTSGLPSWKTLNAGLTNFAESVNTSTPNATISVVSLTSSGAATDIDIALIMKGQGALMVRIPDNSLTGGNKRGYHAVDLQKVSGISSADVASGTYSVICGGSHNRASANNSCVGGGSRNQSTAINSTISGGGVNTASAQYSFIGGGFTNTASGDTSSALGGSNCVSSGAFSSSLGGYYNNATGASAVTVGGYNNDATGDYSVASGRYASTRGIYGARAHSGGTFYGNRGYSQEAKYILIANTTDATQKEMTADNGAGSAANRIILVNYHAYSFQGHLIAKRDTGDVRAWRFKGIIKRGAGAASTTLVGTLTSTNDGDAGSSTWDLAIEADTTNGSLRFKVTGEASANIKWLATIEALELNNS